MQAQQAESLRLKHKKGFIIKIKPWLGYWCTCKL